MIWKNRLFLYGCAVGVWGACLLAGCLYLFQGSDTTHSDTQNASSTNPGALTDEQLKAIAASRHQVLLSQQEYQNNQQQIQTLREQVSKTNKTGDAAPTAGTIFVAIQPGLSLSEIADLLHKAGVIQDPAAFQRDASHLASFVKAGVYSFPAHSNNQTILDMITK